VIFSRHLLATRTQKLGENLLEFLQALRKLSKDCQFQAVTAENYRKEMVRDAFINRLASTTIWQRLLEVAELTLDRAFDLALSLNQAQEQSLKYTTSPTFAATIPQFSSSAAMEPILTRTCQYPRVLLHPWSKVKLESVSFLEEALTLNALQKMRIALNAEKKDILQGSAKPKKPTLPRPTSPICDKEKPLPFFHTIKGAVLLAGLSYRSFHKWP